MDKETLRKAQLVQLGITKEIKRVCDENNISYFLDSGSLLGAVRHKGFIPWDDDMDLGMLREDYERFLQIAPQALGENYELIEWRTQKDYPNPFAKVMRKNTVFQEEAQNSSNKCGIFVDVFPYDAVGNDDELFNKRRKKLMFYRGIVRAKCHFKTWRAHNKFNIMKFLKNIPFYIVSVFVTKNQLINKYESIAKISNDKASDKVYMQHGGNYISWQIPSKCFDRLSEMQFENDIFKIPYEYDLYLKSAYGDYMQLPPESERENRHSIINVDFGNALSDFEGDI